MTFGFGVCVKAAPGHFQRKSKILRTASQMKWRIRFFFFFFFLVMEKNNHNKMGQGNMDYQK